MVDSSEYARPAIYLRPTRLGVSASPGIGWRDEIIPGDTVRIRPSPDALPDPVAEELRGQVFRVWKLRSTPIGDRIVYVGKNDAHAITLRECDVVKE